MHFLVGWSEVDLTPEKKVYLYGQFCERVSEYVETPVCATALALDTSVDCAIFLSCDLESIGMNLVCGVREALRTQIPDFPPEKLIVSATHTHTSIQYASSTIDSGSGLSVLRRYLPDNVHYEEAAPADDGVLTDEEALRHLTEKLTEAAVQAWTARRPGGTR